MIVSYGSVRRGPGRTRRIGTWGLSLLLLSGPWAAASDDTPSTPPKELTELSLAELANVRVTSPSKRPEELFRTTAAVFVITAEEIRRSGARTIPELLRLVPGVDVAQVDASQWAIGVRGFTSTLSRAQLVLIDGRSVYSPLFAGTYWDVQDVLLEDVDRIEVIRGPGGSLWGSNAVNGVINIITRNSKETTGGLLSGGGGNEQIGFGGGRYGGPLGATGHYSVWGKYFDRAAQFHSEGDPYDAWHMYRGGFRSDWDLPASGTLTLGGGFYTGHAGRSTVLSSYQLPYLRTVEAQDDLSGGHFYSKWSKALHEGSELSIQAYYDGTHRAEPTFTETRNTVDFDAQYETEVSGRARIVAGMGYRVSRSETSSLETLAFLPPTRTDNLWSSFAEGTFDLVPDRLKATLGTKVEHNDYSGFEWQPTGRLGWSPSSNHFLWGAVSRAVRTPSRVDVDLTLTQALNATTPVFVRVDGNPAFESERTTVYEVGYRFRSSDRLLLDATAFHNHYDKLESVEPGTPFLEAGHQIIPFEFANGITGTVSGAELSADARPSPRWLLRAGYSFLDMKLHPTAASRDTTSSNEAGSTPRHMVTASSSWNLPQSFLVDAQYRWVADRPTEKVASYSEVDLRVSRHMNAHLDLAAVGANLLHAHHAEFGGAIEIRRSVYGEAQWHW